MSITIDPKEEKFLEELEALVESDIVPKDMAEFDDMALKYFEQQEHDLMFILKALKDAKKDFKDELKDVTEDEKETYDAYVKVTNKLANDNYEAGIYLRSIDYTLKQLNKTLDKYTGTDNDTQVFIERKKAVHEIRKILRAAGKFQKYSDKEFDEIDEFYSKL